MSPGRDTLDTVSPRAHVTVLALFVVLVGLYTWPLARSPVEFASDQTDERLFTWVLLSVARNLVTQPTQLLHGNAFYPMGNSLTFAEPLVTPALVAGPVFALTGNPVLAYKVTLLLFWALSGWAMYAVTFWLTDRHPAAFVAAVAFALGPARMEYWVEFQMEIAFGIPLAIYTLVRFLETQRVRYLLGLLLVFWLQAVAVWYYAVILGCGLVVVVLQYAALRWAGWRLRAMAAAGVGGGALLLALAPVAWPFFVTRRELGFERSLGDVDSSRFADLLTYLTTRGTWLASLVRIDSWAETSLFPGTVALVLAAVGLCWFRPSGPRGRAERLLGAATWACLLLALLAAAAGRPLPLGPVRSVFSAAGVGLLVFGLARQGVEGWRRRRAGAIDRRLTDRDWVGVLLGVVAFAVLLSLGPVVHVAGHPLGEGLYAWLHPYFLPLRVVRGATRFGLLADFAVALLAGFGAKWLAARLPARTGGTVVTALALLALVEYARFPLPYGGVPMPTRPVDQVLRADPEDVAVLEWPTNVRRADVDAMFRSIGHGHRVVNGFAGFVPDFLRKLSGLLTTPGPGFPIPEAQAALRRIHPLRYLVVRLPETSAEWRPAWLALRQAPPPLLRFRGSFGDEDLYEVVPLPERGVAVERWVSHDFLRRHPVLRLAVRPVREGPDLDQWVDVRLNDRPLTRVALAGPTTGTVALSPPFLQTAPNVLAVRYGYRRPPAARDASYGIGATGAASPGDLRVRSAGQPYGSLGSIRLNSDELSPDRRGYNLVALGPAGSVLGRGSFDTFFEAEAPGRLAAWVGALPVGTIVAGAVRDEASGRLTAEAVLALRSLGVAGDLRGHFRESHAFVGVKGAPPGTALEALGPRALELSVGQREARAGFELTAFALLEAAASPR